MSLCLHPLRRPTLFACVLLLVLWAVPCALGGLIWRSWRQERLDRALFSATLAGDVSKLRLLLADGAKPDCRFSAPLTPLAVLEAAMREHRTPHPDVLKKEGMTPLMLAAMQAQPRSVSILLKAGANVQARSTANKTALQYIPGVLLRNSFAGCCEKEQRQHEQMAKRYDEVELLLRLAGATE